MVLHRARRHPRGRLERFLGQSPNEIGTADDADNPSITYHRNTLYAMRGQKSRDLPNVRLLSYSHHWAYHDVTYQAVRSTQAREEIGVQHLALGKKHQPPIPVGLEIRCIAADQITLAYHADGATPIVNNRDRADLIIDEHLGDLTRRQIRADGNDVGRHHFPCFHCSTLGARLESAFILDCPTLSAAKNGTRQPPRIDFITGQPPCSRIHAAQARSLKLKAVRGRSSGRWRRPLGGCP